MKKNKIELFDKALKSLKINAKDTEYEFNESLNLFNNISNAVKAFVEKNKEKFDLENPTIEGESKKIYRLDRIALIELKPTMYSFTHNRYGTVEGTDSIRLDFWKLFGFMLNNQSSKHFTNNSKGEFSNELNELISRGLIGEEYPFISNYLGDISINSKRFAIVKFAEEISPLEIVWKNYLVGTMKHNLKKVDNRNTKKSSLIKYEGQLPNDIIRFDWRNPLPDKDECIPDEFAEFYIDTGAARDVARLASRMLNSFLGKAGYELVDLCYFMNYQGTRIHSEITPDGMRIRKKGKSFDKDLWRMGKDKETITKVWTELHKDLSEVKNETRIT